MLKYIPELTDVVLEEVPDRVTLAVEIPNCQGNCPGCHSPFLKQDIGEELTAEAADALLEENFGVDCFLLLGEGNDPAALLGLARHIKAAHPGVETALYSGRESVEDGIYEVFDFVKTGPYRAELGPLNERTTNQRIALLAPRARKRRLNIFLISYWQAPDVAVCQGPFSHACLGNMKNHYLYAVMRAFPIPFASVLALLLCAGAGMDACAQTATSLFMRSDSLQVEEIASPAPVLFGSVGHNGPAVENRFFALRLYFNDSGAIDLYSKSGEALELEKYDWYPTREQTLCEGAGIDAYDVGRTLGFGGIALWDDGSLVRLKATEGRTARVGRTRDGSFAELTAYGVEFRGVKYDVCMRVEMKDRGRDAFLTVSELSGRGLPFVCGLMCHDADTVDIGRRYISVWGSWSANDGSDDVSVGTGIKFRPAQIDRFERRDGMLLLGCRPDSEAGFRLCAGSSKEDELGSYAKFVSYMKKLVFFN